MKRSDNIPWSQVKVGILIVAALLFLAWGVLLMGEKTKFFTPKGKLAVIMTDVSGLKSGAPVWLAGLEVGIVSDIHFDRPKSSNEVKVILEVEREALKKIGSDSIITVKTRGLLGEKYVDITPSSHVMDRPETRLYGTPVVRVDEVMQKAGQAFDRMNKLVEGMSKGEGSLGRLAKDPKLYDNLTRLTAELSVFTNSINRGEGTLGKLAKSREPYDRLVSVLERADEAFRDIHSDRGTLGKLIHDPQLYNKLVSVADKSEKATEDLRELNRKLLSTDGTIGKLIADKEIYDKGLSLINRMEASMKSLEEVLSSVNSGKGTAGKLVQERELYDRMNKAVDDLDLLVTDVKENPRKYIKFSVF